jgi:hypothetical protein
MTRAKKSIRRKAATGDPDLDVWVRLGGEEPESALDGLTEDQRRVRDGNTLIRSMQMSSTWRTASVANPFGRTRE